MSVETAIWKMTSAGPVRLTYARLDLEERLEDLIVADPSMVGLDVLVVGRQISTAFGGFIDVVGVDNDGHLHVLELKRDRTPRDVVAQTLDYCSWVTELTLAQVATIYAEHHDGREFEDAFAERFNQPLPDVFNADQQMTIVASELDPASDRIVRYLAERFDVPINAVFFRHFADGESEYLTRTWLMAPEDAASSAPARAKRSRGDARAWNGRDYYVIQGTDDGERNDRWEIAKRYGLLNAGGGSWYWKPLRNLTPGMRVFAYVGKVGYVGVGIVTGEMRPAREVTVEVGGREVSLLDAPAVGERIRESAASTDEEVTEMVVPVRWEVAVDQSEAVLEPGLFSSQVTACKLKDERTIELVEERFGLEPAAGGRDWSDLHALLDSLSAGAWTTYGDLAEQVGSSPIAIGRHVASCPQCRAPWRVIGADRKPRAGFRWDDPQRTDTVLEVLTAEGVRFDEAGRADPQQRMVWDRPFAAS